MVTSLLTTCMAASICGTIKGARSQVERSSDSIVVSSRPFFQYHTADNLAVLPENSQEKVDLLANALNFDLETIFSIKRGKPFFPLADHHS